MSLHLSITGRVQGVSYRASFAAQARALGLSGWVRNRRDGSVEALVTGPAGQLEQLRRWAEQGPPLARVDAIKAAFVDEVPVPDGEFAIAPTE